MQITGTSNISSWYQTLSPSTAGQAAPPPKPLASLQLSAMDADGDGSVSKSEFETALESNAPGGADKSQVDQLADKLFQKIDTDNDGKVSSSEWSAFQQKVASAGGGHHHHHHAKAADSDGQDQAKSLVDSLFAAADSNGDGSVTKDEMTALVQKYQATMADQQAAFTAGQSSSSMILNLAM